MVPAEWIIEILMNAAVYKTLFCIGILILCSSYSCEGHLTIKSDVYSFGVVLLEILSGKRALDRNRPSGEHNLVNWAKPYLTSKRKILQVFDARIQGQYSLAGALKAANLANQCLSVEPKFRPNMVEVVRILEQIREDSNDIGCTQNEHDRISIRKSTGDGPKHRRMSADGACNERRTSYPRRASTSRLYM